MKLFAITSEYTFEINNNYKLFQNKVDKKTILKKGKYKEELANYFNELKIIHQDKILKQNYLILKKGFKKYKFNLDNTNLKNFLLSLEKNNLNEFEIIYNNMFKK